MNPRYPIFIPSKSRYETPYTIESFQRIGVPFNVVVEPQEADFYARVTDRKDLIVLPFSDRGLVSTRNWIWDYAESNGAKRFWTFDDNIRGFYRLTRNQKFKVKTGAIFRACEDFADRYKNVAIAGMNYQFFAKEKQLLPPFICNTRIYSNMLILANIPFRNRGIYNDDTDLCLQVLKAGWCTVQFNAFLINKMPTMTVKGGMTPLYQGDGRKRMALELLERHPGHVKVVWKFKRWQHSVNYRPFRKNKLIRDESVSVSDQPNEYGMELKTPK